MTILKVENLFVAYGHVQAVQGISFEMDAGETLALIGSNGAGKSSTLKAIIGIEKTKQEMIRFDGEVISGKQPYESVRRGIGYCPEGRRVFKKLTVAENLSAGGHILGRHEIERRKEQIFEFLPTLGERSNQLAGLLSGGEQQMLAIGRALMSKPRLLILDEPSLGLAPIIVQHVEEFIAEIQKVEQLSVIIAEQNANWALSIASHGIVLEMGKLVLDAPAPSLEKNEYVRNAYLGSCGPSKVVAIGRSTVGKECCI